jgi:hypothetical protein
MTPIKAEKSPGKKASFGYPRVVKPPITIVLDFDRFEGGTFVAQLRIADSITSRDHEPFGIAL